MLFRSDADLCDDLGEPPMSERSENAALDPNSDSRYNNNSENRIGRINRFVAYQSQHESSKDKVDECNNSVIAQLSKFQSSGNLIEEVGHDIGKARAGPNSQVDQFNSQNAAGLPEREAEYNQSQLLEDMIFQAEVAG